VTSATIILEVPAGAPAVPAGFSSAGVVSAAGAGAAVAATAATAGATAAAAGGGHGGLIALGILGAGAAAGGAVIATQSTPEPPDPRTLDNDGDGFTPEQGDCDDRNPDLNPNTTGFEFNVVFGAVGVDVHPSTPTGPTMVTVKNKACADLTVERLNYSRTKSGICGESFNTNVDVVTGVIVRRGQTTTLYSIGAGGVRCCCRNPAGCTPGLCVLVETFTLFSSAGTESASNTYGFRDPGNGCVFDAACGGSAGLASAGASCPPQR
jgi:hypothetical protein